LSWLLAIDLAARRIVHFRMISEFKPKYGAQSADDVVVSFLAPVIVNPVQNSSVGSSCYRCEIVLRLTRFATRQKFIEELPTGAD